MDAKKCDGCEKFFVPSGEEAKNDLYKRGKKQDLCVECQFLLDKFVAEKMKPRAKTWTPEAREEARQKMKDRLAECKGRLENTKGGRPSEYGDELVEYFKTVNYELKDDEIIQRIKEKFGVEVHINTISKWRSETGLTKRRGRPPKNPVEAEMDKNTKELGGKDEKPVDEIVILPKEEERVRKRKRGRPRKNAFTKELEENIKQLDDDWDTEAELKEDEDFPGGEDES